MINSHQFSKSISFALRRIWQQLMMMRLSPFILCHKIDGLVWGPCQSNEWRRQRRLRNILTANKENRGRCQNDSALGYETYFEIGSFSDKYRIIFNINRNKNDVVCNAIHAKIDKTFQRELNIQEAFYQSSIIQSMIVIL